MANIVIFLIQMLQTDYKLKKTIKPEILLVIQRGLDIHVHGDENNQIEYYSIKTFNNTKFSCYFY